MENLKRYIIISIIVVLVVIIAIILLLLYQKKSSEKQSANDIQKIESSTVFMDNNDKNIFYQAEECINTYYDYLNIDDYTVEEYFPGIELSFAQKNDIQNEEDKNNAILTLLDAKYKDSNSINVSNVLEFVDPIDLDNYFYRSTRQKMAEGVNTTTIYAEGEILNKNTYEKVSDVYYIVYLDYSSSTFAIYPLKENTTEIEQYIDDTIKEKSKYNYLATSKISDEDMAFKYFADFKNSAMKKTEYAFNKLDEQYRQNRFSNDKGQFDLYIDKNANELRGLTVNKL